MKSLEMMSKRYTKPGVLYVVGMPIGNYDDISSRALNMLKECDLIICEHVQSITDFLLTYGMHKKIISMINTGSAIKAAQSTLDLQGKVVLLSDRGTCCVSDPGADFINHFSTNDSCKIISIPGPSAVTSGFALTGYKGGFLFHGFLPMNKSGIKKVFSKLSEIEGYNLIFFESSSRIKDTLQLASEFFKEREVKIVREISKTYEEVITFNLNSIPNHDILGEIVLIIKKK